MGIPQAASSPAPCRSDAGRVRLQQRDLDGLLLIADHYAAPYVEWQWTLGEIVTAVVVAGQCRNLPLESSTRNPAPEHDSVLSSATGSDERGTVGRKARPPASRLPVC